MKTKTTFFVLLLSALFSITKAESIISNVEITDVQTTSFNFDITLSQNAVLPAMIRIQVKDLAGTTVHDKIVSLSQRITHDSVDGLLPSTSYQLHVFAQGDALEHGITTAPEVTGIEDAKTSTVLKATVSKSISILTSAPELLGKKGLIYDYTGKVVSEFVIENTIQNIDIAGLSKGFYLISVDKLVIRIVIMN